MHLQRKSCWHVILGMIIVYHSSPVAGVTGKCPATIKNVSRYQHCLEARQDGASELDCFGIITNVQPKFIINDWQCEWLPANDAPTNNYTLVIMEQKSKKVKEYKLSGTRQKTSRFLGRCLTGSALMSAHVINESDPRKCTKAYFTGVMKNLVRCGPPRDVSFRLGPTRLEVTMTLGVEIMAIQKYTMKYKAQDRASWNVTALLVTSRNKGTGTVTASVETLDTSVGYDVQVSCVNDTKHCTQCLWSDMYTLPKRLSLKPVNLRIRELNTGQRRGWRLLLLTWEFPSRALVTAYSVRVTKASGDAPEDPWMKTTRPEMRLNLSTHSAYHLNITAQDGVSTSPALCHTLPPHLNHTLLAGDVNVTFINNASFNISWRRDVMDAGGDVMDAGGDVMDAGGDVMDAGGECYSVEWSAAGLRASHMSFYAEESYKVVPVKEALESYKRYSITLFLRSSQTPCNLKHINNTESSYGAMQAYFIEGSPISAPSISDVTVTQNSMLLAWRSVPEAELRGFLLGYMLYYTEHRGTHNTERSITIPPKSNRHELKDLNSGTVYKVHISAFTRAGEGVRSEAMYQSTKAKASIDTTVQTVAGWSCVVVLAVAAVLMCVIKRYGCPDIIKAVFWPSMPNPHKSNAIQKIPGPCELQLLKPLDADNLEEQIPNNALQVVEKTAETPCLLHHNQDQGILDSESLSPGGSPSSVDRFRTRLPSTGGSSGGGEADLSPDDITPSSSDDAQADAGRSTRFPFPCSDYTTMELFLETAPPPGLVEVVHPGATRERCGVPAVGMDYVRQFSTSPTADYDEADLYDEPL